MPVIQINSDTEDDVDGLLDPPGSGFVFYKMTRPKSVDTKD